MAFKTLMESSKAIVLEEKGESMEGFLIGAKTGLGKFESTIYTLQTADGPKTVWGNTRIDSCLLDEKGKGVSPELQGVMVRITCTDVRQVTKKVGKHRTTKVYRDHKVEVDLDKKLNDKRKVFNIGGPVKKFKK